MATRSLVAEAQEALATEMDLVPTVARWELGTTDSARRVVEIVSERRT